MTVTKSPGAGVSARRGHKSPLRAATLGGMAPVGSGLNTAEILTAGAGLRREAVPAPDLRRMQISGAKRRSSRRKESLSGDQGS
jgi:hypothetical protein